jgi:NAD(P)-dependent dehydrogenase (short-subunit alcohol dehydrogenase family)
MIDLKQKTILITGASSGIGRQCAITFSKLGANLILFGRNERRLSETFNALSNREKSAYYIVDITDFKALEATIKYAAKKNGKISGFIHSAGIESTVTINFVRPEQFEKIFAVNVISAFEIIRILSSRNCLPEEGASYVLLASVMGFLGQPGKTAYCSSKAALINGSKALALELAKKSIRVNCLSPGLVETEMTIQMFKELPQESLIKIKEMHPLGFGNPNDIANFAAFLISDLSKWITGSNLIIDGGYSAQ